MAVARPSGMTVPIWRRSAILTEQILQSFAPRKSQLQQKTHDIASLGRAHGSGQTLGHDGANLATLGDLDRADSPVLRSPEVPAPAKNARHRVARPRSWQWPDPRA